MNASSAPNISLEPTGFCVSFWPLGFSVLMLSGPVAQFGRWDSLGLHHVEDLMIRYVCRHVGFARHRAVKPSALFADDEHALPTRRTFVGAERVIESDRGLSHVAVWVVGPHNNRPNNSMQPTPGLPAG